MHRALQVQDIIIHIFSFTLSDKAKPGRTTNAVSALARTCKMFKDPALNFLWDTLFSMSPLVRCLGPEIAEQVKSNSYPPKYMFRKTLEKADWNIILGYARRVKAIYLLGSFGLAEDSIVALANPPGSTSILPNIRSVSLCGNSAAVSPLIPHLAGPKVAVLSLDDVHATLHAVIDAFGNGCPLVAHFSLHPGLLKSSSTSGHEVSQLICRWGNLHSASWRGDDVNINLDAFTHLSHSPNLSAFSLSVNEAVLAQIKSSTCKLTFPALRRLQLECRSPVQFSDFLRYFHAPGIHKLYIWLDCPFDQAAPNPMSTLTLLQGSFRNDTLNTLALCIKYSPRFLFPYLISFDRLRPLTVFTNIKSIRLDFHSGSDLMESEVLCLVSSWPHLERLKLGAERNAWTAQSGITPNGFVELLARCRSLRVLHIRLDARGYTDIPQGHPWRGLKMPENTEIVFLDTVVKKQSINALVVFFHVAPFPHFTLRAPKRERSNLSLFNEETGDEDSDEENSDKKEGGDKDWDEDPYAGDNERLEEVVKLASDLWKKRKALRESLENQSLLRKWKM